ncbi:hypothetical protein LJR235_002903 [Pararhizobium sp. LjRoot235]|jgi:hypothetical protein|uniref:hypothetical protein n=1 Tax=Pararhizobium sp. LjRoot235 TaxID=3342291 RepID=UPI003ED13CAD
MDEIEIERLAAILWKRENPDRPWTIVSSRAVLGQDIPTGASQEDRDRYIQRVRDGER